MFTEKMVLCLVNVKEHPAHIWADEVGGFRENVPG